MEDVALATDLLDKDTSDEDRVALMTIHLAKDWNFLMFCGGRRRFVPECNEYEYK
jgi:hypothetical protein